MCLVCGAATVAVVGGAPMMKMPDGRQYPAGCVHWLEEGERVESIPGGEGDVIVRKNGGRMELPRCTSTAPVDEGEGRLGYYSSWIVDAVAAPGPIGSMVSNWTVPMEPASRGPVPGMSSAYIFNGLEDGAGKRGASTMILQPVLSYGKSGCVLDPLAGWRFTSFHVTGAGRAYCGPSLRVRRGDSLQGRMELVAQDTWRIVADAGPRGASMHTAVLPNITVDSAYLALEGMVVYSCAALPGEGVAFTGNALAAPGGRPLQPCWHGEVRHPECRPRTQIHAGGDVEMAWDVSDSAAASESFVV